MTIQRIDCWPIYTDVIFLKDFKIVLKKFHRDDFDGSWDANQVDLKSMPHALMNDAKSDATVSFSGSPVGPMAYFESSCASDMPATAASEAMLTIARCPPIAVFSLLESSHVLP